MKTTVADVVQTAATSPREGNAVFKDFCFNTVHCCMHSPLWPEGLISVPYARDYYIVITVRCLVTNKLLPQNLVLILRYTVGLLFAK